MKLPVWYFTMSAVPNTSRRTIPSSTRFGGDEDPIFEFKLVKQHGSVKDYQKEFDRIMTRKNILPEHAISGFITGLKPKVGFTVKNHRPFTLPQVYQLARNTESQLLHLLEVDKEHAMIVEDQPQETEPSIQQEGENVVCKISLQALQGLPDYQTLRVTGYCDQGPLKILIGPGSTHNFMEEELIKKWGLGVQTVNPQLINAVDGGIRKTVEACKVFNCLMGGASFEDNFLLIPLGSSDIILGDQWLKPLGDLLIKIPIPRKGVYLVRNKG
ncbi:hypothetical protein H5410_027125 [Solanum commersonii]|uniref:Retrotransposon gag domain-containing protein n=1 Tax=Solanum commersonii TaxID=4109 RepID=A0A9J5YYD4_SOLCO|nr:hypothetical protein H5410_027125 [Solanum commersonii]